MIFCSVCATPSIWSVYDGCRRLHFQNGILVFMKFFTPEWFGWQSRNTSLLGIIVHSDASIYSNKKWITTKNFGCACTWFIENCGQNIQFLVTHTHTHTKTAVESTLIFLMICSVFLRVCFVLFLLFLNFEGSVHALKWDYWAVGWDEIIRNVHTHTGTKHHTLIDIFKMCRDIFKLGKNIARFVRRCGPCCDSMHSFASIFRT